MIPAPSKTRAADASAAFACSGVAPAAAIEDPIEAKSVRLIDRSAQELGDQNLKIGSDNCRDSTDRETHPIPQRHADNAF
jgi:hypothetical protein